jgi:hypothetical protein
MGLTNWRTWASVLVALGACSEPRKPAKAPPEPLVVAGPSAPELGWRETSEVAERAPISLTASDGGGLELVALHARTVIEDPLAFTELHLRFRNPESRRREGRFEIALPEEAAISRFAMRVGDHFQEGEVVERRRAQVAYEDFLHRKQDPALLEKDAGNEFAARVFPIEADADKEIIVAYSEELRRSDVPYRLLLSGLPKLRDIRVDVRVGSASADGRASGKRPRGEVAQLQLHDRDFTPMGDLEVRLPWQKAVALRHADLVVVRVAPVLDERPVPVDGLTVLFDTSASRALGFRAQIDAFGGLMQSLRENGRDFDLRVIAFDQDTEEIYRGPASGFGEGAFAALRARGVMGATDLVQALGAAARGATGHARVLVVGDGVVTAGDENTTRLREAVAKLAAHGVRRLDVFAQGGIRDASVLAALTRAGLAEAGVVLDYRELPDVPRDRDPVDVLAGKMLHTAAARVEVRIAGASWVYPRVLEGVQSGDERLVFASLPAGAPLQVELVGAGVAAPELQDAPRPLIERAWTRARIAAMQDDLRALPEEAAAERDAKEREIVALSVGRRVVSDLTAMLVLESEYDYERYGIDRKALTDILRVGEGGIELVDRAELEPADGRWTRIGGDIDEEGSFEGRALERATEAPTTGAAPVPAAAIEGPIDDDGVRADHGAPRGGPGGDQPLAERSRRDAAKGEARAAPGPPPPSRSSPEAAPMERRAAPESLALRSRAAAAKPMKKSASADDLVPLGAGDLAAPAGGRAAIVGAARSAASSGQGAGAVPPGEMERRMRPPGDPTLDPAPKPVLEIAAPTLAAQVTVRAEVVSGVSASEASRSVRALSPRARACYERSERRSEHDRLSLVLAVSDKGTVADVRAAAGAGAGMDPALRACVVAAARGLRFPKPAGGNGLVTASLSFSLAPVTTAVASAAPRPRPRPRTSIAVPSIADAYDGALAEVLTALASGDRDSALDRARAAHEADPGDVIALVALGEVLEAREDFTRAARAYGSLIDLFPSRADMRRMAAARLERLPGVGLGLAIDSYRRAVEQRPDHPSGARSLAYARWKAGDRAGAFAAIEEALARGYRADRFEGVDRILREDLGLIAAAWLRAEPDVDSRVGAALSRHGVDAARAPSLRFVLSWETDANDVDFHIHDGRGGHAYYMKPKLPSGGSLYADITTGYGPECFEVPGAPRAYPYVLQAHYFARGPMGYGMGKLQVIEHDGEGVLRFREHPFVIMKDKAFVELSRVTGPLG